VKARTAIFATLCVLAYPAAAQELSTELKAIRLESGDTLQFETGTLSVPENRATHTGRTVSIAYYRFRSTSPTPGAPVFLLGGGPGDSWLEFFDNYADSRKEALFYREVADVVLFDQRGAGSSRPRLDCPQRLSLPLDKPLTPRLHRAALRKAAAKCRADWIRAGVDLSAYNTRENAADVDALRSALGYESIQLVGGSYGSHLAFALLRYYPRRIQRVVLDGLEGPDHTYDLPSGVLANLQNIALALESDPSIAPRVPEGGLIATLAAVQARLAATSRRVSLDYEGRRTSIVLGGYDAQLVSLDGAHDRPATDWAEGVLRLHEGNYSGLAKRAIDKRLGTLDSAMYYMMDCASGISAERRKRLETDPREQQAKRLLGDPNFNYTATCDIWNSPDAGDAFRADLITDVPALLFRGTWDLSTPADNALSVAPGFKAGTLVTVEGATHSTLYDLYQSWLPMRQVVSEFLRGQTITPPARIDLTR
jgi:pimeloyl-ACP methyl ester carboxylesterase